MKGPGYFLNGDPRYASADHPTAVSSAATRVKRMKPILHNVVSSLC